MTTMTEQAPHVGRYLFADLVHIDVLIEANHQPARYAFDYSEVDPRRAEVEQAWRQYDQTAADLGAARAAIEASLRGILCAKCLGRGSFPSYRHRHGGVCFSCQGHGLTAKGRKAHPIDTRI